VFDVVLAHFADQFDVVVLDTPAATDSADAQILAAHAGAAILLARRNHTRHAQLRATMQCFAETGVNVIGSVMSMRNDPIRRYDRLCLSPHCQWSCMW
jgi:receptor protein-tyrosine kinase